MGFFVVFGCKSENNDKNKELLFWYLALTANSTNSSTYSIGGTISGLLASGSTGLVLQNNSTDDLSVDSGSTSFTFSTKTSTYDVTVKTQPSGRSCTVSNGSGTATADVTSVSISCSCSNTTSLLGGSIQGCELSLSTAVTTLAGSGSSGSTDATGISASFNNPGDITTDGTNLYVADTSNHKIRKVVISSGVVTTLAGSGSSGSTDATGTSASFNNPYGITTDGTNLYVADKSNHKIRKVVISSGVVTTLAGSGSIGSTDATGTSASFDNPYGITTDGTNLYVADTGNNKIRKVVISSGVVTTLAGSGSIGSTDATGTSASFYNPNGITTDGTKLYINDLFNHKIRVME